MNILYNTALWIHNGFKRLTGINDTISTPEVPVPSFFKDELLHKYETELLEKLEEASKIESAEQRLMALKEILADNWKLVQGTFLSYTSRPDDKLTLRLCNIASDISDITKQSPIEVLMPGLQTDSFHDNYPSLHEAGAPDLKEILRTHILSEDGTYLIPIKVLTELPSPLEKDTPLNNYYYDYSMSAEKATVRPTEYSRLEAHSEDTRALFDARAQYDRMINNRDNKHLLGHLQDLIRGLYMNGAYGGLGVQTNAGIGAYPAIIRFVEFYDTLEQAQKDHIPQPVREEIERIINLASDPNINYNATENTQTCVADNSKRLESAVKAHEEALAQIGISDEKQSELLRKAKTCFDKAHVGLDEAVKKKTYRGRDKLGLTRALLERFEVVPSVYSKEQLDYFLTLSASEIEEVAKNNPELIEQLNMQFPNIESFVINTLELSDDHLRAILNLIFETFVKRNIYSSDHLAALFISLDVSRIRIIIKAMETDFLKKSLLYRVYEKLTPEQKRAISEEMVGRFSGKVKILGELHGWISLLIPEHHVYALEAIQDNLPEIIKDVSGFNSTLSILQEEARTIVFEIMQEKLPEMIKSGCNFGSVVKDLSPKQRAIIFEAMQGKWPEIIKSGYDFYCVLCYLTPEQRAIVFEIMQEKLIEMSENPSDEGCIINYLTTEQCEVIREGLRKKLSDKIKTIVEFTTTLDNLHPKLRPLFFEGTQDKWPKIVKSGCDFGTVLRYLTPQQRASVFEGMKDKLPEITNTPIDFANALRYLTPEQSKVICEGMKENLPNILKSIEDVCSVLPFFSYEQCAIVFEAMKDHLSTLMKSKQDYYAVVEYFDYSQKVFLQHALSENMLGQSSQYVSEGSLGYFNSAIEQSKALWGAFFGNNKRKRDEESEEVSAEPITKKRKVERVAAAEPSVLHQYPLRSKRKAFDEGSQLEQEPSQAPTKRRRKG